MDESAIQAQIKAIDTTLVELKDQLERGYIDFGRYSRLKTEWERKKAELEARLEELSASPEGDRCSTEHDKPSRWAINSLLKWLLGSFIFVIVVALFFARPLRCLLEYRMTDAIVALAIFLAGGAAAAFAPLLPPGAREVLRSLYGGVASALLLCVVVAVSLPSLPKGECFPTPTHIPSPTPTAAIVHLADARVSFTITLSGDGKREVPAGGTLTLAPGDKVLIELSVTVGTSPFPRDLTYRYFAPGGSIPEELTGPSASYVAPEQPGSDVITVQITDPATGDSILHSINVVVSEGS